MRFALLGEHPNGLAMARALTAKARHELAAVMVSTLQPPVANAPGLPPASSLQPPAYGDVEEILANPAIEMVVVASPLPERPAQLRRALQSEKHVLCVYPPGESPDIAYEAALIQGDTHRLLLPLLPESHHPAVLRLTSWLRTQREMGENLRLVRLEQTAGGARDEKRGAWSVERGAWGVEEGEKGREGAQHSALSTQHSALLRPSASGLQPDWLILRAVGGEIAEVSAFASGEEIVPGEPLSISGRFEGGGLFQASLLPGPAEARLRLTVSGDFGEARLFLTDDWTGPARLERREASGTEHVESWEGWDPWPVMVEVFESAVAGPSAVSPIWDDAVHCLELDDAVRRSVARRRAVSLEYAAASEETGFKGTMTLIGCGMIWVILLLMFLSIWLPGMGWLIMLMLAAFLLLQVLGWIVPKK